MINVFMYISIFKLKEILWINNLIIKNEMDWWIIKDFFNMLYIMLIFLFMMYIVEELI